MNKDVKIQKGALERIEYLDGIRGISSILVIFCHLSCVFVPSLYFAEQANTVFSKIWINTPLNILTNGNIAVQSFFVLSGYLITRKCYIKHTDYCVSPLYEYKKLLRVVVPGVLFSAMLMAGGLMYHLKAYQYNSTLVFVRDYCNFNPTVKSVLSDSLFRPFFEISVYNGPLWTIKYEFWGAVFTAAISYYCYSNKKNAKAYYLLLGIIFFIICPNLVGFMTGAFAFDCLYQEKKDKSVIGRLVGFILSKKIIIILLFIVGLYFTCINNAISGLWKPLSFAPLLGENAGVFRAIGIAICIICIKNLILIQKILSLKCFKWLGKISAFIYAFHWPVLLSAGCGVYLLVSKYLDYYYSVLISSIVVLVLSITLSALYLRYISPLITLAEKRTKSFLLVTRNKIKKNN